MNTYIVIYDLSQPGRNYDDLYNRIKLCGSWAKITESSWAIRSSQTPVAIRDYLQGALDQNDKILVGQLGACAWAGLDTGVPDWLKQNI